jgi:hypothetical protein
MGIKSAKVFLGFAIAVVLLGTGCKRQGDHDRDLLLPTRYVAQVEFDSDGVTCKQTLINFNPPVSQAIVDMSQSRGDTITWVGKGALPTITVTFPPKDSDNGEGTPFHQNGQGVFIFNSGDVSSSASLDGRPTDWVYPLQSITINVNNQNQPCQFPVEGMGVHVSK